MADTVLNLQSQSSLGPGETSPAPLTAAEEEELLLEGLRQGADQAYQALIFRFEQPVYNLVCRLLNDPSDAPDVVQEVFLKVFRKVAFFRGSSSLKTWIFRISVNEALNHRRWFSRRRRQEVGLEGRDGWTRNYTRTLSDPGRSPYDYVLGRERYRLIEEALSRLHPGFRAAVVLRDIEDLSYGEIAGVLQISLGTVKSRIMRGRQALRKALAGRLEPEPALSWAPQEAEWNL